jgi:DNA-binding response OmpR family regulator
VLVAADDPDLRRWIARPLLEHGFDVVEATDAADALQLARSFVVDVAIVDVGRSVVDVAELLRRWEEVDHGWYVPIVLVGARGAPDAVVAAIHLGAHDELLAPFDDVDVIAGSIPSW